VKSFDSSIFYHFTLFVTKGITPGMRYFDFEQKYHIQMQMHFE